MLRAAGSDPARRAEALEVIIVQHEQQMKLRAAVRQVMVYSRLVSATGLAVGIGLTAWIVRRATR
jgi:hypothetical protein